MVELPTIHKLTNCRCPIERDDYLVNTIRCTNGRLSTVEQSTVLCSFINRNQQTIGFSFKTSQRLSKICIEKGVNYLTELNYFHLHKTKCKISHSCFSSFEICGLDKTLNSQNVKQHTKCSQKRSFQWRLVGSLTFVKCV